MKLFEKLQIKIKEQLNLDLCNFQRCYQGFHQRSIGGWSWEARENGGSTYGSVYTARELLNKDIRLCLYQIGINQYEIVIKDKK